MSEPAETDKVQDEGGPIECRVTMWFYRRMGLLSLMFLFFAGWFYKDHRWGYPDEQADYDVMVWFGANKEGRQDEQVVLPRFNELRDAGTLEEEWPRLMELEGFPPLGEGGGAPRWMAYAKEQGIRENPKPRSQDEIDEQLHWAIGSLVILVVVLGWVALHVPRRLRADGVSFTPPGGKTVRFEDVFRLDLRKWDNKGLAYAFYREGEGGSEKRATIDDLKFGGADRVLARLMDVFEGEIIEKVEVPDEEEEEEEGEEGTEGGEGEVDGEDEVAGGDGDGGDRRG